MQIYISKDPQVHECINDVLKLYCIIKGRMFVNIYERQYEIGEEEILILNQGHRYEIFSSEDTLVFIVEIENNEQTEVGKKLPTFICSGRQSSYDGDYEKYQELFTICKKAIIELCANGLTQTEEKSYGYQLLAVLERHFYRKDDLVYNNNSVDDRIMRVHRYINEHFAEPINMTDLASMFYMSKATLSRHFKKEMGVGFAEYLSIIRVEHAKRMLKYTKKPISFVAVESGFTNTVTFTNAFKNLENTIPSEYRKKHANATFARENNNQYGKLIKGLGYDKESSSLLGCINRRVEINSKEYKKLSKTWNMFMNLGTADDIINSNVQKHIVFLKKHLGFKYGRIWGVFSKKMCISDGESIGEYNFDKIDMTLDFLVNNDIIPFIDFGLRPNTAVERPGRHIFFENDYIEFKSFQVWKDLVRDFILHIRNRYGTAKAGEWIFEFTWLHMVDKKILMPDEKSYFANFTALSNLVKEFIPEALVGGPMCHLGLDNGFIRRFLSYMEEAKTALDFVSFMLFPYAGNENNLEEKIVDIDFEQKQIEQIKRIMADYKNLNSKIFITEWNNTLSNRNYINDSCYRMTYLVSRLVQISQQVDGIGIWTASDWISSYYDTKGIVNGASGLLSKDLIPKPAFYGIQFMNMLGSKIIYSDSNVIVTATNNNSFYILFYNYKQLQLSSLLDSEIIKSPSKIEEIHDIAGAINIKLVLENMSLGRYVIKKRIVNDNTGNVLNLWSKFNYETEIQSEDINYMKAISIPELRMEYKKLVEDRFTIEQDIKPYEIILWHIYPS